MRAGGDTAPMLGPPHLLLTLSEFPRGLMAPFEAFFARFSPLSYPQGDGHPVLVIPGFTGDDGYNQPLIQFLGSIGYHARGWNLGRNIGHGLLNPEVLLGRLEQLHRRTSRRVSLVGHSLGGIYAREIAKLRPDQVRQVITLASPIGKGRSQASHFTSLYRMVSPHRGKDDDACWADPPPVPTTAVYTRSDGVMNWRVTLQRGGHERTENVEVCTSHTGITLSEAVWFLLADRLRTPPSTWRPFRPEGWRKYLFPSPAWQPLD